MNSKLAFAKKQRTKRKNRKLRNVKRNLKTRKPVKDLSKLTDDEKKTLRKKGSGAFGGIETRDFGDYKTLRVLYRSKRTKDNCNKNGILKD